MFSSDADVAFVLFLSSPRFFGCDTAGLPERQPDEKKLVGTPAKIIKKVQSCAATNRTLF